MSDTDPLSPLASELIRHEPGAYAKLVVLGSTPAAARTLLADVTAEQLLAVPLKSHIAASAMLAGLWLWHDALSECHHIAQKDPEELAAPRPPASPSRLTQLTQAPPTSPDLSRDADPAFRKDMTQTLAFWHAIMHRREGDFSNSKYWYARVGRHPMLQVVGAHAGAAINHLPADKSLLRLMRDGWDANAFVDLVEDVSRRPDDPRLPTVIAIQCIEWQILFDHCTRQAAA